MPNRSTLAAVRRARPGASRYGPFGSPARNRRGRRWRSASSAASSGRLASRRCRRRRSAARGLRGSSQADIVQEHCHTRPPRRRFGAPVVAIVERLRREGRPPRDPATRTGCRTTAALDGEGSGRPCRQPTRPGVYVVRRRRLLAPPISRSPPSRSASRGPVRAGTGARTVTVTAADAVSPSSSVAVTANRSTCARLRRSRRPAIELLLRLQAGDVECGWLLPGRDGRPRRSGAVLRSSGCAPDAAN